MFPVDFMPGVHWVHVFAFVLNNGTRDRNIFLFIVKKVEILMQSLDSRSWVLKKKQHMPQDLVILLFTDLGFPSPTLHLPQLACKVQGAGWFPISQRWQLVHDAAVCGQTQQTPISLTLH